jgi:predicted nucleic acid-binding protein
MRVLFDNDVVLDLLLRREPYHIEVKELFLRAAKREIVVFVSAITPINCFYIIRKEKDLATAGEAVRKLLRIVGVSRVDKPILDNAFSLGFSDFEDAVQCSSAMKTKLDAIITRNIKDFTNSPIATYTPADFLEFLGTQEEISLGP